MISSWSLVSNKLNNLHPVIKLASVSQVIQNDVGFPWSGFNILPYSLGLTFSPSALPT